MQLIATRGPAVTLPALNALHEYLAADSGQPKVFETKWMKRLRAGSPGLQPVCAPPTGGMQTDKPAGMFRGELAYADC